MKCIQRTSVIALAIAVVPVAWAAGQGPSQAQQQYQRERAHCMSGQSHQDRATCLKEAANAYGEARRGALDNGASANYAQNAIERCRAQPPADQEACVQRIMGADSTQGSVKRGGLIRETETTVK